MNKIITLKKLSPKKIRRPFAPKEQVIGNKKAYQRPNNLGLCSLLNSIDNSETGDTF